MKSISLEIWENYQVRKTKKQKNAFIDFIQARIPEARVEESKIIKSKNIVVGDTDNAEVVIGAHYDTCARLPFPNFLTPKNLFIYLLYTLLLVILLIAIDTIVAIITYFLVKNIDIALTVTKITSFIVLLLLICGPANKHTANDNTSGIVTLLEIMGKLTDEQKQKVAFVFFDNEESGLLGSMFFNRKHKKQMKNKLLINFDCVSDGDNIMVIQNKKALKAYNEKIKAAFSSTENKNIIFDKSSKTFYPSDQVNFPCNIAVAAFKKNKIFGLYVDKIHTNKDTNFDETNIECISDCIVRFIETV